LWSAGQSVELIEDILSCEEVLLRLEKEITTSFEQLSKQIK
jgi:NAD(P)H-dependent flavin oxidoreductase YrpB (nitropropane dioxygenase family)